MQQNVFFFLLAAITDYFFTKSNSRLGYNMLENSAK